MTYHQWAERQGRKPITQTQLIEWPEITLTEHVEMTPAIKAAFEKWSTPVKSQAE